MSEYDRREQEAIHEALSELIPDEGEILTGWIVIYETADADGEAHAGHAYGPPGMTTWRALGLVEWARTQTLPDAINGGEDGNE